MTRISNQSKRISPFFPNTFFSFHTISSGADMQTVALLIIQYSHIPSILLLIHRRIMSTTHLCVQSI